MIGRAQGAHQIRFGAGFHTVQDMDVEPNILAASAARRPIGPAPVTRRVAVPEAPPANEHNLFQRFCDDGGRLQEHAEQARLGSA